MGEQGTSVLDAVVEPAQEAPAASAPGFRMPSASRRTIATVAAAVLVVVAGVIGGNVRVAQVLHDEALADAREAQVLAVTAVLAQREAVAALESAVGEALETRDAVATEVLAHPDLLGGSEALAPVAEAHAALAAGLAELLSTDEPTAETAIPDAGRFTAPAVVSREAGTDSLVALTEELTLLATQADAARAGLEERSGTVAELTGALHEGLMSLSTTIPASYAALLAGHPLTSDAAKAAAAAAVEALGSADADADPVTLLAAYAATASDVVSAHDAEVARRAAEEAARQAAAAAQRSRGSGSNGGSGGGSAGSVTGASEQRGVLSETNANRAANDLGALAWNGTLASRACSWAAHLASVNGDLAHSSNSGGFSTWGENVAYGYGSASAVVAGWMNSSGHRANILRSSFTMMGACSSTSSTGRIYWVQQFGG